MTELDTRTDLLRRVREAHDCIYQGCFDLHCDHPAPAVPGEDEPWCKWCGGSHASYVCPAHPAAPESPEPPQCAGGPFCVDGWSSHRYDPSRCIEGRLPAPAAPGSDTEGTRG